MTRMAVARTEAAVMSDRRWWYWTANLGLDRGRDVLLGSLAALRVDLRLIVTHGRNEAREGIQAWCSTLWLHPKVIRKLEDVEY